MARDVHSQLSAFNTAYGIYTIIITVIIIIIFKLFSPQAQKAAGVKYYSKRYELWMQRRFTRFTTNPLQITIHHY